MFFLNKVYLSVKLFSFSLVSAAISP